MALNLEPGIPQCLNRCASLSEGFQTTPRVGRMKSETGEKDVL